MYKEFFLFVKLLNQRIKYMHLILPLWNVRKISQPLQNESYSDVSKFHCQEGDNVMIHKPHLHIPSHEKLSKAN